MEWNFDEIIERSGTDSVQYDLRKTLFGKEDVLPMWVADMDFKTPAFVMEAIRRRAKHEVLGYSVRGEGYQQALVDWVKARHNWEISKDCILFSPGVVPALSMLVMTFTEPGDKVIVQPPVYFPFFSSVKQNRRRLLRNPLFRKGRQYVMDLEQLKSRIDDQTRMIFLCHPHNPVGRAWTEKELRELADICLEHQILMVSDEIHCDLVLPGHSHIPLASLSPEIAAQTITCMAPSKTFNLAGLATSHVIISDEKLRKRFNTTLEQLHAGMGNIFGTVAAEAAYRQGDEWRRQMLQYVQGNVNYLDHFLKSHIPEIRMIRPEATYMAWLDCRGLGMEEQELKDFMIFKAGLGLNDGPMFGEGGKGYQRINLACPRSKVEQATRQLSEAIITWRKA
jgi:cystathionine beta-lyase